MMKILHMNLDNDQERWYDDCVGMETFPITVS